MTDPKNIMPFFEKGFDCPKCGNSLIARKYDKTMDLLIWRCSCGHDWYMRAKDYEEKSK